MRLTHVLMYVAAGLCLSTGSALSKMATSGAFQVTPSGSAAFSIPITVPPGTAGVQPDLALTYDSQSGNGPVGAGWGISGLSGITRCPRTVAQDGVLGSVNFNASDRFCLDGQRLVPASGSYTSYGSSGFEYRTEIDSFSRIVSYGTAGTGPAWFAVWTKSGQILEYGNSADSRIEAQGKTSVRVWAINKRRDVRDNEMTFHYLEDTANGDYVIDEIRYTGNSRTGMAPNTTVKFVYDAVRPDKEVLYIVGSRIQQVRRMTRVQTRIDGTLVREYRLAYEISPASERSRISAVVECGPSSNCLPVLSFDSSGVPMNTQQFFSRNATTVCANGSAAYGGCNDGNNRYSIRYPDIDGDGRADLCFRADAGIRCYLANGTSWNLNSPVATTICADTGTTSGICNDADNYDTIAWSDFNGDGRDDLVYRGDQGVRIWFSTGSGFTGPVVTDICANGSTAYGTCNDSDNLYSLRYPDLNGDSRADLCIRSDSGISCFLSTGSGLDTASPILTNICANNSSQYGVCNDGDNYDTITYADIDNDGRDDLVYRGDQGVQVWYSTGTGFANRYATTLCANNSTQYGGCRTDEAWRTLTYTDVAGNGLLDLCYRSDAGFRCYAATGAGWDLTAPLIDSDICKAESTNYACAVDQGAPSGWQYYIRLAQNYDLRRRGSWLYNDVNGDGRSDLMYRGATGMQVWISTGTSFAAWRSYDICGLNSNAHGICNDEDNYRTIEFIDVDGNGVADLVYRGDQGIQLWRSQIPVPDLLTTVTTSLGHVTSVTHKPITDPAVHTKDSNAVYPARDLQFSMYVVSAVSSSNGIGGTVGTTHRYGGLKADLQGRGLLGFRWTETTQTQSDARTQIYRAQNWPFIGMPSVEAKFSGTQELSRTNYTLQCRRRAGATTALNCAPLVGYRYFPYVSQRIDRSWDLNGTAFPTVTTTTQYSTDFGNPTQVVTSASDGHSKTVVNTYDNITSEEGWWPGLLRRAQVTTVAPGVPNRTRTSAFTYNSFAQLEKEIIEPDDANLCLVTAYGRDTFGNKRTSTLRNCNGSASEAPAPTGDAVFAARTSTVNYDARGQFPETSLNALGHTQTHGFDARFGAPSSLVDPNGLTMQWQYDLLGRPIVEIRPDNTRTRTAYWYCSGVVGGTHPCPAQAKYVIETTPLAGDGITANGPWSKTYFDMADRTVRTETVGLDGSTVIQVDTEYDALGRTLRSSRPRFAGAAVHWTTYKYDALGRVESEKQADNSTSLVAYNGPTTTITNALGRTNSRTVNSQGQAVSVTDVAGQVLAFQYDATGNLYRTTDPSGNIVEVNHDLRGRKTQMIDPDMGTWSYAYNAVGELIRQTDAKSQISTMQYDLLGRMTQRTEPDLVSSWYYDAYKAGGACGKGIGQLCEAEANNGYSRQQHYDDLGRPDTTSTTFGLLDVLNTAASYDANGRLDVLDYPTLFGVKHVYTPLGYLKELRNKTTNALYWRADEMNAEGQLLQQTYGNALITKQTFDPQTGRLKTLRTGTAAAPGARQDLSYDYDVLGNVKTRSDLLAGRAETFTYDLRDRVRFQTVTVGGNPLYTLEHGYDALGNLASRSDQGAFQYNTGPGAVRPHAVKQVDLTAGGRREYEYDPNGNLTQMTRYSAAGAAVPSEGRTVSWTAANLPATVAGSGTTLNFTYGPERQRTKKQAGLTTTTYLNPDNAGGLLYERDVTLLAIAEQRFFVMAGGRIAAIVKKNGLGIVTGTDYVHQDALGSVTVVTNASGAVAERSGYEPFGKRLAANGQPDTSPTEPAASQTNRGFTQHEHLSTVGLIHMNGRVYDPLIGRFVSPDPIVQAPENLQSYNRYSYVLNNPLKYTDPSGFSWWSEDGPGRWGREVRRWERSFRHEIRRSNSLLGTTLRIAGFYVSGSCGPYAPACAAATEAIVGRAQGVTGGRLIVSSVTAAVTAQALRQLGPLPAEASLGQTATHYGSRAAVGCFQQAAGGGNCGQGAGAAFLQSWTTVRFGDSLVVSIVAGGIGSAATGGRFEDGALTGAFSYLLSNFPRQLLSYSSVSGPSHGPGSEAEWRIMWELSQPSAEGGWIVQEMTVDVAADGESQSVHYWEAWKVGAGDNFSVPRSDTWASSASPYSSGSVTWTGSARFYEGLQLPDSFAPFAVKEAGFLRATTINPNLPLNRATPPVNRAWRHEW